MRPETALKTGRCVDFVLVQTTVATPLYLRPEAFQGFAALRFASQASSAATDTLGAWFRKSSTYGAIEIRARARATSRVSRAIRNDCGRFTADIRR